MNKSIFLKNDKIGNLILIPLAPHTFSTGLSFPYIAFVFPLAFQ